MTDRETTVSAMIRIERFLQRCALSPDPPEVVNAPDGSELALADIERVMDALACGEPDEQMP